MPTLQNKTILVTGASQGLGEQVAKSLCRSGGDRYSGCAPSKKAGKVYDAIVEAGCPEPFAICFDLIGAEEKEFEQFCRNHRRSDSGETRRYRPLRQLFLRALAFGFQTCRRMGQPIPYQHR